MGIAKCDNENHDLRWKAQDIQCVDVDGQEYDWCLKCRERDSHLIEYEEQSRLDRIAELVKQGYTSGYEADFSWNLTIN